MARKRRSREDHSGQESWLSLTPVHLAQAPGSHMEQLKAAPSAKVGRFGHFLEVIDSPPATVILFQALETIIQCLRNAIKGLSG